MHLSGKEDIGFLDNRWDTGLDNGWGLGVNPGLKKSLGSDLKKGLDYGSKTTSPERSKG